jgi:hypothetical protein
MKLLDIVWFNKVGIARVEDAFDGVKYYIKDVEGLDEELDIINVMNWGSTFPKAAGNALFGIK